MYIQLFEQTDLKIKGREFYETKISISNHYR